MTNPNNNLQPTTNSNVTVSESSPYDASEAAEIERQVTDEKQRQSQAGESIISADEEHVELLDHEERTDNRHAANFAALHRECVLFVTSWMKFYYWNGGCWRPDEAQARVTQFARKYANSMWQTPELIESDESFDSKGITKAVRSFVSRLNNVGGINATVSLAKSAPEISAHHEELNSNPDLFNVLNGTYDLRTGTLRAHDPNDRITQIAKVSFDSNAVCPRWIAFLEVVFAKDFSLIRYVQQLLGYALSGNCSEAILVIAVGRGSNGKSVLWNVIDGVLADYSLISKDSLLMGTGSGHTTDQASLYQKRFVAIAEAEENVNLKEAKIKELTGERKLTARRLYENPFEFIATHTLWMTSNSLPTIRGTDEGIWRRLKVIPFGVDIRDVCTPDKGLTGWLISNESSGILNWLLAGYVDWNVNGFIEPEAVSSAVSEYRAEENEVGRFIAEKCEKGVGKVVAAKFLFESYQAWHGSLSKTQFGKKMKENGFAAECPNSGAYRKTTIYHGLTVYDPNAIGIAAHRI